MTQHIGIVGCSAPGAALCYQTICTQPSVSGSEQSMTPEVSLHTHPFSEYLRHINNDDWQGVAGLLVSSADKLARLGAGFCIAPCNTVHLAFEFVRSWSRLPWLHIAEEVALEARRVGCRRVALLGTQRLMESHVYANEFERVGIEWCIPDEDERERINRLIFNELVFGVFESRARLYLMQVIKRLQLTGCDAVGMCCTELPILLAEADTQVPLLDSTKILALAALNKAS